MKIINLGGGGGGYSGKCQVCFSEIQLLEKKLTENYFYYSKTQVAAAVGRMEEAVVGQMGAAAAAGPVEILDTHPVDGEMAGTKQLTITSLALNLCSKDVHHNTAQR